MANIIRTPKSGHDWTQNELDAYHIRVVDKSLSEFFNLDQLPPVPPPLQNFCEAIDKDFAIDSDTFQLLHDLDNIHDPELGYETMVDNFAANLLRMLGYAENPNGFRLITACQPLRLLICGVRCSAQTDVCVSDRNNLLLLVQEDKGFYGHHNDPEPQLVAEAIAAYQRNNS